jgi:hypothetical protein
MVIDDKVKSAINELGETLNSLFSLSVGEYYSAVDKRFAVHKMNVVLNYIKYYKSENCYHFYRHIYGNVVRAEDDIHGCC